MKRRQFNAAVPALLATSALPLQARSRKDTLELGITLEPSPGLDPTAGASSSIGEITLYNIFETLTKIRPDGSVAPLLATAWQWSDDRRRIRFGLRPDIRFSDGTPCTADQVKYSFERAAADDSTNKDKSIFAAMQAIEIEDPQHLTLHLREPNPDLLFYLGQATAVIVDPASAADNGQNPVGTGPYRLQRWARGSSITLEAVPDWREAGQIAIRRARFRIISDSAAQVAAVLSGDLDCFARVAPRGLRRFQASKKLQTLICDSRAKTVLAINNARKPLDDVRVRRAISMAIDRQALIIGAGDGLGVAIGSHYVRGTPGYIDTTDINPYDPARAKALLQEAGVSTPLPLNLVLPPPAYARQGGEIIQAELARIGIQARIRNVEWAQWLAQTFGGSHDYDLTLISHVEPFDLENFSKPDYYWGYHSDAFDALYARTQEVTDETQRLQLLEELQLLLARDAVLAWLYQPQWVTVADERLQGLWANMPIFTNELAALHWT